MSDITLEKLHDSVEKIAQYLVNEVPRKSEVASKDDLNAVRQELNEVKQELKRDLGVMRQELKTDIHELREDVQDIKGNINIILDGMDAEVKQLDIIRTEQVAFQSGLSRAEKRVEKIENKVF